MTNHAEPSVFAKCIYDKGNKLSNAFYAFTHSYNVKVNCLEHSKMELLLQHRKFVTLLA